MTDDLVKRLRSPANVFYEYVADNGAFLLEAADRIEKLEAFVEAVIRYAGNAGDDYLADKARKALEGKND